MKNFAIVLIVGLLAFACNSFAQAGASRIILKDTLVNADTSTISFNSIGSHLKSLQVSVYKISGTVAGSVYIQGTDNGVDWESCTDTLTLSNQATNTRTWKFTGTFYNSYRPRLISSGTMQAAVTAALLRVDE